MIDVQRVDYIRVPVTDMEKATQFYEEVLGLERNPNSRAEDWVEYETGNVTLAVMTPHTHEYEFTPLPPGRSRSGCQMSPRRRRSWRQPACRSTRCGIRASAEGPGSAIRTGTRFCSTTATSRTSKADVAAWTWPDSLDALTAAPESHRLLFENDDVRVLETTIASGATTGLHTHRWPGPLYVLSFDHFVRRDADGTVLVDTREGGVLPEPGSAVWSASLAPHTLENVGAADIHVIGVELKRPD